MRFVIDFFRLIRFPNLLIIFLTQYAIRLGIVRPFLQQTELDLYLSETLFLYLALATISIAAAGYIINDYFDVKLDHINKPKQTIVGNGISRRMAMLLHVVINAIGLALALKVALSIHHPWLFLIQLISAGLLWYYSVKFKKQVLIGNFIIAALTALVPFTAGYYDLAVLYDNVATTVFDTKLSVMFSNLRVLMYWILGYSSFAFLLSLIREIIKDMEDIEGDKAFNCRTFPIVYGIEKSKRLANVISIFTALWMLTLLIIQYLSGDWISLTYFGLFLFLPLCYIIYRIGKASHKKDFFIISQLIKLTMLFGIFFTAVMHFFN